MSGAKTISVQGVHGIRAIPSYVPGKGRGKLPQLSHGFSAAHNLQETEHQFGGNLGPMGTL